VGWYWLALAPLRSENRVPAHSFRLPKEEVEAVHLCAVRLSLISVKNPTILRREEVRMIDDHSLDLREKQPNEPQDVHDRSESGKLEAH
jgi:hypothetical protein